MTGAEPVRARPASDASARLKKTDEAAGAALPIELLRFPLPADRQRGPVPLVSTVRIQDLGLPGLPGELQRFIPSSERQRGPVPLVSTVRLQDLGLPGLPGELQRFVDGSPLVGRRASEGSMRLRKTDEGAGTQLPIELMRVLSVSERQRGPVPLLSTVRLYDLAVPGLPGELQRFVIGSLDLRPRGTDASLRWVTSESLAFLPEELRRFVAPVRAVSLRRDRHDAGLIVSAMRISFGASAPRDIFAATGRLFLIDAAGRVFTIEADRRLFALDARARTFVIEATTRRFQFEA